MFSTFRPVCFRHPLARSRDRQAAETTFASSGRGLRRTAPLGLFKNPRFDALVMHAQQVQRAALVMLLRSRWASPESALPRRAGGTSSHSVRLAKLRRRPKQRQPFLEVRGFGRLAVRCQGPLGGRTAHLGSVTDRGNSLGQRGSASRRLDASGSRADSPRLSRTPIHCGAAAQPAVLQT